MRKSSKMNFGYYNKGQNFPFNDTNADEWEQLEVKGVVMCCGHNHPPTLLGLGR